MHAILGKWFFNLVSSESWIEARLIFVIFSRIPGELDEYLGVLFLLEILVVDGRV